MNSINSFIAELGCVSTNRYLNYPVPNSTSSRIYKYTCICDFSTTSHPDIFIFISSKRLVRFSTARYEYNFQRSCRLKFWRTLWTWIIIIMLELLILWPATWNISSIFMTLGTNGFFDSLNTNFGSKFEISKWRPKVWQAVWWIYMMVLSSLLIVPPLIVTPPPLERNLHDGLTYDFLFVSFNSVRRWCLNEMAHNSLL